MFIIDSDNIIIDISDSIAETINHIIITKNREPIYYAKHGLRIIDLVPPDTVIPARYTYINGIFEEMPTLPTPLIIVTDADKQLKIKEINQAFIKALNTQFKSETTGIVYDYSVDSQISFSKLAISMISGLQTYPVDIVLADGITYLKHDQSQCQQVLADIGAFESSIRDRKKDLLQAVALAYSIDDLNAIVW